MPREFAVPTPDLRLPLVLLLLSVIGPVVAIAVVAQENLRVLWALVALPLVTVPILITIRRRYVAIDGDTLRIAAGMHSARIRIADLELDRAEVTNLNTARELLPAFQIYGTSMPGYRAGHYRLRDRSRLFMLVTDRARVLHLRECSGRHLLLSLEKPQALLDVLRDVASRGARR